MNIIDVTPEVLVIPYVMLPKPVLPNGKLAVLFLPILGEMAFDNPPPGRKIKVVFRQGPNHMDVVRHNHIRYDGKGIAANYIS